MGKRRNGRLHRKGCLDGSSTGLEGNEISHPHYAWSLLPLPARYLAIRYPLKSRDLRTTRNAGVAIVVIWSLSLLFAGPYLSYYQIVHYHGVPICVPIWEDQRRKILDILTFVFGYLLPVTVVSLAYARTIKFLWTLSLIHI